MEKLYIPLLEETMAEKEIEFVIAEVFKIDENTGNSYNYRMPVPIRGLRDMLEGKPEDELPKDEPLISLESPLRFVKAVCNVGDFLIIEGETYRRIRGGFRPATDDDLAELLAAKLGEEDLEEPHENREGKAGDQ